MENKRPTIGILSPWYGGFYFGAILSGIHQITKKNNGRVVAVETIVKRSGQQEQPIFDSELAGDLVDGWIIIVDAVRKEFLIELKSKNKPVVLISPPDGFTGFPVVTPDNFVGVFQAVHHLIEHGHTNIAFVGYLEHLDVKERLNGYKAALIERSISINEKLIFEAKDNTIAAGGAAGIKMLRSQFPFTAVIAATDLNAIGIIEVLKSSGLRIPEDIAVIGFDDLAVSATFDPPLTSVRQQFEHIASRAGELLIDQIMGKETPSIEYKVATELIIRNSCGCSNPSKISLDTNGNKGYTNYQIRLYYEEMVVNSYKIIKDLYMTMIYGSKDLSWLSTGKVNWACLALHSNKLDAHSNLMLERYFSLDAGTVMPIGEEFTLNHFPPKEILPLSFAYGGNNILVLLPLKTQTQDLGLLSICLPIEIYPMTENGVMEEWAEITAMILENENTQVDIVTLSEKVALSERNLSHTKQAMVDREKVFSQFLDKIDGNLRYLLGVLTLDVNLIAQYNSDKTTFNNLTEIKERIDTILKLLDSIGSLPM